MKIKAPTICNYCAGKVIFTDSAIVYGGKSYGSIYYCTNCGAYVGVYDGSRKPLGTLANAALRMKRRETHEQFDGWWRTQGISRSQAYKWLALQMRLPEYRCHIGQFDMAQCQQVIEICVAERNKEVA